MSEKLKVRGSKVIGLVEREHQPKAYKREGW